MLIYSIPNHYLVEDSDDELSCTGLSENRMNHENVLRSVQRKKEVLISSVHPLLVCCNAMKKSHKCVYCKCYECYMRELKMEQDTCKSGDGTENNKNDTGLKVAGKDHQGVERPKTFLKDKQHNNSQRELNLQVEGTAYVIIQMI